VCLGNICRSPPAHGVFEHLVEQAGFTGRIQVDSAGVADWHTGKAPDKRSQEYTAARGYNLSRLPARRVPTGASGNDERLRAMDGNNLRHLLEMRPSEHRHKVKLFLEFAEGVNEREVPDPYYGDGEGFELVLDLVDNACQGLLNYFKRQCSL